MKHLVHKNHPFRIFFISAFITIASLVFTGMSFGVSAMFVAIVLMLVEVTFSFDNAIINARILATMSRFWQTMFLTVGMVIAVFGMRLVFPILLVMMTAQLSPMHVIDLALNDPTRYAEELHKAHPLIASFGGMFLLMLCFNFFFDPGREVRWIHIIERPLQRMGKWWIYTGIALICLAIITVLPWNNHPSDTLVAGLLGIFLSLVLQKLNHSFTVAQEDENKPSKYPMWAGFMSFMYLQILDASFSFDGVLGAFAVTNDVILIAIGLGVGALWVRSLTIFMVRKQTLQAYRYLEHGAHYTIGVLAIVLLAGLFVDIPEAIAGVLGLIIVGASISNSLGDMKKEKLHKGVA